MVMGLLWRMGNSNLTTNSSRHTNVEWTERPDGSTPEISEHAQFNWFKLLLQEFDLAIKMKIGDSIKDDDVPEELHGLYPSRRCLHWRR
jgi:hypothetical protein